MKKIMAIVLAAGQGKRMKSKLYKVLHPVGGKPMVGHVVDIVKEAASERTVVIVGHGAETVKAYFGDAAEYALQEQQLGTGHAVRQAEELLGTEEGTTIVICGDTPLVQASTIEAMLKLHGEHNAAATVLSASFDNPNGYGRVIRGEDGTVQRIVEHKDCSPEEIAVKEINTGTYCFDNRKLFDALNKVTNDNTQGEYYLTDVIGIFREAGEVVQGYCTDDAAEAVGINDRVALSEAERFMKERINRQHLLNGVTIIDPSSTYIEAGVQIGSDTVLYPGTFLRSGTIIGTDCVIGPSADIANSTVADGVTITYSVVADSVIGEESSVGPYANLRPGTKIGKGCKVGDFVELKNASLDDGSKVSHLSYIGDAKIGKDVNVGCGAITVNYDGFNKALTEIGDNAFIGSNANLIAPVKIGDGAYVVAGTTVTQDVPAGDLAIARERQVNKPGYADKIRARAKAKKERSE
ncbi:bifunctional UDP-N-acetylglucosamine diphosphorylase/glucosamine-1-phosphate N-acetyltransferase GlmU [Paenibacillus sp. GSMTC-2017]|uniref:bifunctional UDP-N-acetylglucosamine diphosphorylase/glucosamine-1-phosphate N-acetyltransferase GlmU n=1 Tax=Paenibacillus sp. GSMTC-2017 TaxID=2794350 RepID=UPI0018D963B5|nr:bifunctional UDP-N-acetylglucosamine diphosphorylase/glucosamine-1-phosphate N-acetyltransferase GlmU [Paenibacillus sp. GSMTC-2017]MBH5320725.1 bifunctional UDP-N-acetylglucosamine diphosphorylase/glucosamine-1-phosphate N-acetyltransferase GlmU [Paenibacillus sp. GSMTC-2017]